MKKNNVIRSIVGAVILGALTLIASGVESTGAWVTYSSWTLGNCGEFGASDEACGRTSCTIWVNRECVADEFGAGDCTIGEWGDFEYDTSACENVDDEFCICPIAF
jgi:uncharacterized low-complexity protein